MTDQLSLETLNDLLDEGARIVDVRPASSYAQGHIPGTINIPLGGSFMTWVDWVLDPDEPVYVITSEDHLIDIEQVFMSLGIDAFEGYFDLVVIKAWQEAARSYRNEALQSYTETDAQGIAEKVQQGEVTVLDVRQAHEWKEGHIPGATHIPLDILPDKLDEVPTDKPVVVQCRSGGRSAVGVSLLQAKGVTEVQNLRGGIMGWARAGLPMEKDN